MSEWNWISYIAGFITPLLALLGVAVVRVIRSGGKTSGANSREPIKENVVVKKGS